MNINSCPTVGKAVNVLIDHLSRMTECSRVATTTIITGIVPIDWRDWVDAVLDGAAYEENATYEY